MQDSVNYLMEDLGGKKSEEELEAEKKKKEAEEEEKRIREEMGYDPKLKMTAEQKEQLQEIYDDPTKMSESAITCTMTGLQVIVINDIGSIFTPVLDFNMMNTVVMMTNNNVQQKVSIIPLILKAKYFNPRVGEWEPIIEEIGFNIDFINNAIGTIKQHIVLEINENYELLNINFSTQFLVILLQMLNML